MRTLLYVITGMNRGGAEKQVFLLARHFSQMGFVVHLVSLIEPKHYIEDLEKAGVVVHSLAMKPGAPDPRAIVGLRRIINEIKPHLVHSHMYHANVLCRVVKAVSRRFPLVSTAHNIDECEGSLIKHALYRSTRGLADFSTNVSDAAYRRFVELGFIDDSVGQYIPNGVEVSPISASAKDEYEALRAEMGIRPNQFLWLTAGRLVPAKNHESAIDAIKILVERVPKRSFKLLIAGEGPLESVLKQHVRSNGLCDHVSFLGLRKDIDRLMNAMDGFVLSSLWEGLPLVLLEALCHSKPVVSTRVGGVEEVIRNGETGFLVEAGDSEQLANAMANVMASDAAQRLGRAGRKLVQSTYSLERVCDQWLHIYSKFWR